MHSKRRLIPFLVLAASMFLNPNTLVAEQTTSVEKLLEDVVTVENDKMTTEEFGLLSFPWAPGDKTQLRFYSEAPRSGLISRDNFVGITAVLQTSVLFGFAMEIKSATSANIESMSIDEVFDFDELDAPIGNVDLEINVYMSKGGLQIEFVNTRANSTERNTMTWKEILE